MKKTKKIGAIVLTGFIVFSSAALSGCKEKDPLKEAQKNLKKTSENVKDAAKDAEKNLKNSIKDVKKAVEN
ncbi:MAG: hypothetical protein LBD29_00360 [Treponema sp.]|nr:hypothetical protein [Treponema sp.]